MENVLTSLKAIITSLFVAVVGIIPAGIAYIFVRLTNFTAISFVISGFWMIFSLWFWGYLVNRWWKWG